MLMRALLPRAIADDVSKAQSLLLPLLQLENSFSLMTDINVRVWAKVCREEEERPSADGLLVFATNGDNLREPASNVTISPEPPLPGRGPQQPRPSLPSPTAQTIPTHCSGYDGPHVPLVGEPCTQRSKSSAEEYVIPAYYVERAISTLVGPDVRRRSSAGIALAAIKKVHLGAQLYAKMYAVLGISGDNAGQSGNMKYKNVTPAYLLKKVTANIGGKELGLQEFRLPRKSKIEVRPMICFFAHRLQVKCPPFTWVPQDLWITPITPLVLLLPTTGLVLGELQLSPRVLNRDTVRPHRDFRRRWQCHYCLTSTT